ncbi:MAG: (E)-4-hydroxy-3-methylbut-2-enyl-diphosphate synthase [Myxococcota bacterium]|nr:(E)-4-hydroxy-3-methylbut-2-enyl-diphosphate synthase [Myxococcota bacterium]
MRNPAFVPSLFLGQRRPTREVRVGGVGIGGANPIRIQSMTTTDTRDTIATSDQAERMAAGGCEIVRITAPAITDAENLQSIKAELGRRGVTVPLVADIHFTPNAAMIAAQFVEKVRINPGNYADRKKFEVREYTDTEYAEEIERVADRFRPLVLRCRESGVAMRIGTNHGSLSDRIMNRHGDTPLGMVESALEFLDVCEDEGFREIVFSMKASNPQVAIHAYRLLAARLEARNPGQPGYPFHVGVTEAGEGEDGRVKSAIGIGALLEDGLGDTLRVSLTEDPTAEIPVARALALRSELRWAEDSDSPAAQEIAGQLGPAAEGVRSPYAYSRRATKAVALGSLTLGDGMPPRVELGFEGPDSRLPGWVAEIATSHAVAPDLVCESVILLRGNTDSTPGERVARLREECSEVGLSLPVAIEVEPGQVADIAGAVDRVAVSVGPNASVDLLEEAARAAAAAGVGFEWVLRGEPREFARFVDLALEASRGAGLASWIISIESNRPTHGARVVNARLEGQGAGDRPLVLRHRRSEEADEASALLDIAVDLGASLCDGIGDGVSIVGFRDPALVLDLAYRVLQGARLRTTRTEYISCPSCGRTLFDLEETTAKIRSKTEHLKGVKIAVMGCIVNGPGEMADADFGYVGSGVGQVNLYVGQEVVARAVPEGEAPDRLIHIIREQGRWVDVPK